MVPFAGYDMPVTYPAGLIKEHQATREAAGLFDVSHMGQCYIGSESWETTARALEASRRIDREGGRVLRSAPRSLPLLHRQNA
jgi:glycine cleavage system aminomethyltransferase T